VDVFMISTETRILRIVLLEIPIIDITDFFKCKIC
jgi:hypothetical protein